jgi:hypothetical protein
METADLVTGETTIYLFIPWWITHGSALLMLKEREWKSMNHGHHSIPAVYGGNDNR